MDEIWKRIVEELLRKRRWPILLLAVLTYSSFKFTENFFYPYSGPGTFHDSFLSPFFWGTGGLFSLGSAVLLWRVALPEERARRLLPSGIILFAGAGQLATMFFLLPSGRGWDQLKHLTQQVVAALKPKQPANADLPIPSGFVIPRPTSTIFAGCHPEGLGGDSVLNRLKNRIDEPAAYIPVAFDQLVRLQNPHVPKRREFWTLSAEQLVARYEGLPITVEGYLIEARTSTSGESALCYTDVDSLRTWDIFLARSPFESRENVIASKVTARIRSQHPGWRRDALSALVQQRTPVRLSGWLLYNQMHINQVGHYLATAWQISPVTEIEVLVHGEWALLENIPTP